VARVLHDDDLRAHLSAAGLARSAGFDWVASQQRFVSLIREAVGSS
jgi:hypothetical protein